MHFKYLHLRFSNEKYLHLKKDSHTFSNTFKYILQIQFILQVNEFADFFFPFCKAYTLLLFIILLLLLMLCNGELNLI